MEPGPLGRDYPVFRPPLEASDPPLPPPEIEEPEGEITLEQALALALLGNPELASFAWEVRAAEARALQAGLLPNPEFEVEMEEFGGTRERSGLDGAETSFRVGQLIELAGKRAKRARVAALGRAAASLEWERKRLDVFADTARAFIEVLAAQARLEIAGEALDLAEAVHRTVSERVQAGKVSPLEETKARVTLAAARIDVERARRELQAARMTLAAAWGGRSPRFTRAAGRFEAVSDLPSLEALEASLKGNPEVRLKRKEVERRRASVDLEEARRIPDPTLTAGVRHYAEGDSNAFLIGLSIPFPLFNRNQGGVAEARHALAKALAEEEAARTAVHTGLERAYRRLSAAHVEVRALETEILPAARTAFQAAREGYRQGKFGYLQVLDAQRTLVQVQGRHIEALAAYHRTAVEIERLTARRLAAALRGTGETTPEENHHENR